MTPPSFTHPALAVPHGFFTRVGGVSRDGYATLNAGLSGGDDAACVHTNRERVGAALDLPVERLLGLTQVHSADVVTVTAPWGAGEGVRADAMVTDVPGLGLGIITADCAPVLFADGGAGVVGAAHAGWRGALAGVLEATLEAMARLGATRVVACVGPCIARRSYQVAADLREPVLATDAGAERFFAADGLDRWTFDLPGYCAARLSRAGALGHALDLDTYSDAERFFSHRRRTHAGGGVIGHQISVIRL